MPAFETYQWYGVLVPNRTPRDIVVRLNRELVEIMRAPEITTRLETEALTSVGDTPERFHVRSSAIRSRNGQRS